MPLVSPLQRLLRVGCLVALGALSGCGAILEFGDYSFDDCIAGHEGCECTAVGDCNDGLECRLPGICVDPGGLDAGADGGGEPDGGS